MKSRRDAEEEKEKKASEDSMGGAIEDEDEDGRSCD